jgi:multidrug efflux pump
VFFAVVATTIVLISVFAPLMFLPGYIGACSSNWPWPSRRPWLLGHLALSLSPMLASKLLRPPSTRAGWPARSTPANAVRNSYGNSLDLLC